MRNLDIINGMYSTVNTLTVESKEAWQDGEKTASINAINEQIGLLLELRDKIEQY